MLLKSHKTVRWKHPVVSVTNTSREIIDFLLENFGGNVSIQKKASEKHSQAWVWSLHYDDALALLERIQPYLVERRKSRRAALLLAEYKRLTPRNGKYTATMIVAKEQFEEAFFAIGK